MSSEPTQPTPLDASPETIADRESYPPARQARYTVAVLTLAMVLAFVDRQIPTMLVEPIKADLGLSDTQIALLGGAAFSVFYSVMALPLGWAIDRLPRNRVLAAGILTWSLMTALAAFASSFAKLFGARIGVAVGEAVIAPASVSLVSDSLPPRHRGRAMGIISAGVFVGMGLALLGGGLLIDWLSARGGLELPLLGSFRPWQAAFLIVGLPGLLVALAALAMKEPTRRASTRNTRQTEGADRGELLQHLRAHRRTLLLTFGGVVFMGMLTFAFTFWAPAMMVRRYSLSLSEVGATLGIITIVSSLAGTLSVGWVCDALRQAGRTDAPARVLLFVALAALPFAVVAPVAPSLTLSWFSIAGYMALASAGTPLALLCVSDLSTSRTNGQMAALYALVVMLFSMSLGPQIVAVFTDFVFKDAARLDWALSCTATIVVPAAIVCLSRSLAPYRRSVARLSARDPVARSEGNA